MEKVSKELKQKSNAPSQVYEQSFNEKTKVSCVNFNEQYKDLFIVPKNNSLKQIAPQAAFV